jgi:hypothetical protein
MAAETYSLLDLLLELLRDGGEAEKFADAPDEYLKSKGLDGICADDVKDAAPLVLDYAPVAFKGSFDRTYDTGFRGKDKDDDDDKHGFKHRDRDDKHDDRDEDDKDDAVKEIHNILNNYSYTSIDDRDNIVDQSVNQQIYNKGLLYQNFDNDSVIASGDGAVAAGGDVYGAATGDGSIAAGRDNYGDVNTANGDYSVAGNGNEVGNTEIDVEIEDSFQDNSDNSINDSYNTDNSVEVEDSFNKELEVEDSFNKEVEVEDSFNKEVEVEDSFNKEKTEIDVDVELEESGPGDVIDAS